MQNRLRIGKIRIDPRHMPNLIRLRLNRHIPFKFPSVSDYPS